PFELGCNPSPASITPAFTKSSLNLPMAVSNSVLGNLPASESLVALTITMNFIVVSPLCGVPCLSNLSRPFLARSPRRTANPRFPTRLSLRFSNRLRRGRQRCPGAQRGHDGDESDGENLCAWLRSLRNRWPALVRPVSRRDAPRRRIPGALSAANDEASECSTRHGIARLERAATERTPF